MSPLRQCVSCRESFERSELIRILKDHSSDEFIIAFKNQNFDLRGLAKNIKHHFGRSFYICNNHKCLDALEKNKRYKNKIDGLLPLIKERIKE